MFISRVRYFSSNNVKVVLNNYDLNGGSVEVDGKIGETLLQASWNAKLNCLEGACDHAMACSTCQVLVEREWFSKLPKPSEEELDMLDLAHDPQDNSRLACQIVLTSDLNGITVRIPSGVKNILDDFDPF